MHLSLIRDKHARYPPMYTTHSERMPWILLPLRRTACAGAGRMVCAGQALLPTHPPPRRHHIVLPPCLPYPYITSFTAATEASTRNSIRRKRYLPTQQQQYAGFCSKPKDGQDGLSPPSTASSTPASSPSTSSGSPQPPRIDIPGVHYADKRLAIVYTCKVRSSVPLPFYFCLPPCTPNPPSLPSSPPSGV